MTNEELTECIENILEVQQKQGRIIANLVEILNFLTGTTHTLGEMQ